MALFTIKKEEELNCRHVATTMADQVKYDNKINAIVLYFGTSTNKPYIVVKRHRTQVIKCISIPHFPHTILIKLVSIGVLYSDAS